MTKCLIECLIAYFYYLTADYVVRLFCHLSNVYREPLEPSLINGEFPLLIVRSTAIQ
jgi:hypothetical protein